MKRQRRKWGWRSIPGLPCRNRRRAFRSRQRSGWIFPITLRFPRRLHRAWDCRAIPELGYQGNGVRTILDKKILPLAKPMELISKYRFVLLIAAVGILLMLMPSFGGEKRTRCPHCAAANAADFSVEQTQKSLRKSYPIIDGVGRVRVMLTVASGIQRVYQSDREISYSGPGQYAGGLYQHYADCTAGPQRQRRRRCRRRALPALCGGAGGMRRRWQFRYSAESKRGCVCADRAWKRLHFRCQTDGILKNFYMR